MLSTIKYTFLALVRMPGIMIWSLLFPLVLMSVFSLMFSPLDDMGASGDPIPIAVVEAEDSAAKKESDSHASASDLWELWDASMVSNEPDALHKADAFLSSDSSSSPDEQAFSQFIEAVSSGEERLFEVTYVSSAEEARQAVASSASEEDALIGYVQLVDGKPQVHISGQVLSSSDMEEVEASILIMVMDEYAAKSAMLKDIIADNPAALSDSLILESVLSRVDATEQIEVTHNQPKESARYYFALLGMAALFGGSVSLVAFQRMKPNISALGARRTIAPCSHRKTVVATLVACWIINFVCLLVAYVFLRVVVGMNFVGRDAACIVVIAVSSLMALSLGCAVSAMPKVPENGKSGILTGIVCFSALFAGLYGQPTMELADTIALHVPALAWINPATQISQAFYSVMYYDSLAPVGPHLFALLVMTAVFFVLSVRSIRSQRYAGI